MKTLKNEVFPSYGIKQFTVLFVAETEGSSRRYFVERVGDGPWTLPQIHIFGSRDTIMNSLTSKASHIGLSCNVGKEITYLDESIHSGPSNNLISTTVCCRRFWSREGARMVTFEEVFAVKPKKGPPQFDSLVFTAIAKWRQLSVDVTMAEI